MTMEHVEKGVHWGATDHGLYGTDDRGLTWFHYPFNRSTIRGFLPRSADEVLIWDGHGVNTRFNRRTNTSLNVATLDGYDVVDVVVSDSLWIAYGGRQYSDEEHGTTVKWIEVYEFVGSREDGFVLLSRDAGASWQEIDTWPRYGIATISVNKGASRIMLAS